MRAPLKRVPAYDGFIWLVGRIRDTCNSLLFFDEAMRRTMAMERRLEEFGIRPPRPRVKQGRADDN